MPKSFVYADEYIPGLFTELIYSTPFNFVGEKIDGYLANRAILTCEAAKALAKVQSVLSDFDLGVKIWDAYRPLQAVEHFTRWASAPENDRTRQAYYPHHAKSDLFDLGYIASSSAHSRGSTVDLTLVNRLSGYTLDMGSLFDFFDEVSWISHMGISDAQRAHRLLLQTVMKNAGFDPYHKEWWHFTLRNEPFPETYFDFPVD